MKYVVLVGDGMSDFPLDELDGHTPLEVAQTPHMDDLARRGQLGLARTIPDGMPAGSDIGNMSIFGYDPRRYYTGRGPLEAINMGIDLADNDVAFRCNTVCIQDGVMADFSAGHIPSDESRPLMRTLDEELGREAFSYELQSGEQGTVHIDHVLEYNRDPRYMRDLLLYKLTLVAQQRVESSPLSTRELIRRLGTSPAQFYRLLDQTNYTKSIDQLLALLSVLDCDVDLVVKERTGRLEPV